MILTIATMTYSLQGRVTGKEKRFSESYHDLFDTQM